MRFVALRGRVVWGWEEEDEEEEEVVFVFVLEGFAVVLAGDRVADVDAAGADEGAVEALLAVAFDVLLREGMAVFFLSKDWGIVLLIQ